MRQVQHYISGGQFKRDVQQAEKRGKDMSKLRALVMLLLANEPLPAKYKDHPLKGDWKHHRNSHIEPDWLLIYKIGGDSLHLVRTGTHADIFGK
ncbi:MAG: damage-inducible protein [Deltaproteobacteria bacterium RIFOXYD12_FULL_53_23]|nr:MAG: damage-inducible protein [Deltaproteobacteria bacterium RIFOXYD12_FULL_53_23]